MSFLDNIKRIESNSAEQARESNFKDTDIFNPAHYQYAIVISSAYENFVVDDLSQAALLTLFSPYGDVLFANRDDDPESFKRWKLLDAGNNAHVLMFNFFGNSLTEARMIYSLCTILKKIYSYSFLISSKPLICQTFIKCDPTHRNNIKVWYPPVGRIEPNHVKNVTFNNFSSADRMAHIQHFGVRYFHFEYYKTINHDFEERIVRHIERRRFIRNNFEVRFQ